MTSSQSKAIRTKVVEYLKRAEDIKKHIEEMKAAAKAPQKPQAEGGGSGTGNGDNSELREALMSNVVMDSPNVSWDDVCGKSSPKEWVSFARSSLRSRALPRPLSLSSLPRGSMWTVKPPPVRANERGNGPRDLCAFGPLAHPTSRFTKIQRGGPVKHTHLNTTVASWQEPPALRHS